MKTLRLILALLLLTTAMTSFAQSVSGTLYISPDWDRILKVITLGQYRPDLKENKKWCADSYTSIQENIFFIQFQHMKNRDMDQAEINTRLEIQNITLNSIDSACDSLIGQRRNNKIKNELHVVVENK